jgi:hypothetical protein
LLLKRRKKYKLDPEEQEILDSFEKEECYERKVQLDISYRVDRKDNFSPVTV